MVLKSRSYTTLSVAFVSCVACTAAVLIIGFIWDFEQISRITTYRFGEQIEISGQTPSDDFGGDGYCSAQDIVDGTWETREVLKTQDQLKAKYHLQNWHHSGCRVPSQLNQTGWKTDTDRALAIASPTLIPRQEGCKIRTTSWRSTIKRLLRMPMGMTLIGDSLTLQHMDTIDNLLRPNNGPVLANFTSGINRSIYLDLEHPDTLVLIAEAGVSNERASLPLVTWWRTNLLASDEQLQEIFRETGLYKYRDDAVVDWYPSLLARWQGVPPTRNYAEGIVEEPNVVMVEVGTHWIGAELGYLIKEEDLITGWYRMVDEQEAALRSTPIPMSLFWRTVSPPQIDCIDISSLDNSRDTITDSNLPDRKLYNYHFFPRMIERLRSKFLFNRSRTAFDFMYNHLSGVESADFLNPPFRLVDIWNMSIKRPEAHLNPPDDCLHFCYTGITDYWQKLLWHMIMEESRNRDYEEV